jgi:hypothetical protein
MPKSSIDVQQILCLRPLFVVEVLASLPVTSS